MGLILGACLALGGAFVAGRYTAPRSEEKTLKSETKASVVTDSASAAREVKDVSIAKASDTVTTETTIRKRNGEVVRRRTTHTVTGSQTQAHAVDLTVVQSKSTAQVETKLEQKSSVVYERPNYALEGNLLLKMKLAVPTFDNFIIQGQKRVLGPAWLGAGYARIDGKNYGVLTLRFEF